MTGGLAWLLGSGVVHGGGVFGLAFITGIAGLALVVSASLALVLVRAVLPRRRVAVRPVRRRVRAQWRRCLWERLEFRKADGLQLRVRLCQSAALLAEG